MPQAKKMSYANGKIYIIRNTENNKVYIGSTTQPLCKRMVGHRCSARDEKKQHFPLYVAFNEVGVDRFYIELVEDYPCENIEQLLAREGHFIREFNTHINGYNKQFTGRSREEYNKVYYEQNKDKIKQSDKEYYEQNKDKIAQRHQIHYEQNKDMILQYQKAYREQNKQMISNKMKEFREKNKEKLTEKNKEYREKNKVQIREKLKQQVICECGCQIRYDSLAKHRRSQQHQKWLQSQPSIST